jgi:hypothetical protein
VLEAWFALRYGRTEYQHIAIYGPADEGAAKVREVFDAGAELVPFTLVADGTC